jgi:hypothetical protein
VAKSHYCPEHQEKPVCKVEGCKNAPAVNSSWCPEHDATQGEPMTAEVAAARAALAQARLEDEAATKIQARVRGNGTRKRRKSKPKIGTGKGHLHLLRMGHDVSHEQHDKHARHAAVEHHKAKKAGRQSIVGIGDHVHKHHSIDSESD